METKIPERSKVHFSKIFPHTRPSICGLLHSSEHVEVPNKVLSHSLNTSSTGVAPFLFPVHMHFTSNPSHFVFSFLLSLLGSVTSWRRPRRRKRQNTKNSLLPYFGLGYIYQLYGPTVHGLENGKTQKKLCFPVYRSAFGSILLENGKTSKKNSAFRLENM
jgi:hypothetical protein